MGPATLSRYLALPPRPPQSEKRAPSSFPRARHVEQPRRRHVGAPRSLGPWAPVLPSANGTHDYARRPPCRTSQRLISVSVVESLSVSLPGASASAFRAYSPLCHIAMRAPKANELTSVSYVAASSLTHYRCRRDGSTIFVCAAAKESLFRCCSLCLCAGPVGRAVGHG
jgi:hypothetical protein